MKAHGKSTHKPRSLDEVDVELEEAIGQLRRSVERTHTGRVHLTIERLGRTTIGHNLEADRVTTREVQRCMEEIPGWGD